MANLTSADDLAAAQAAANNFAAGRSDGEAMGRGGQALPGAVFVLPSKGRGATVSRMMAQLPSVPPHTASHLCVRAHVCTITPREREMGRALAHTCVAAARD